MKQREVKDQENVAWQCVQPLSGNAEIAKAAEKILKTESEQIEIVCTPSKGAQSVRIEVPLGWYEVLSDEQLLSLIKTKR